MQKITIKSRLQQLELDTLSVRVDGAHKLNPREKTLARGWGDFLNQSNLLRTFRRAKDGGKERDKPQEIAAFSTKVAYCFCHAATAYVTAGQNDALLLPSHAVAGLIVILGTSKNYTRYTI